MSDDERALYDEVSEWLLDPELLAFSGNNGRLLLIGSERSCPRYYLMLRMLVRELKVPNVCFERYASPAKLAADIRSASCRRWHCMNVAMPGT